MQRTMIVSLILGMALGTSGCGDFLQEIRASRHGSRGNRRHRGRRDDGRRGRHTALRRQYRNPPECPAGFQCVPDPANGNLPFGDVGGICHKQPTGCSGVKCGPTQHVCDCAGGAYCLAGNAACIAPTAPCPSTVSVAVCRGTSTLACAMARTA